MRKLEPAFQKSFKNLSDYGRLFYTQRQLYYEVCRNLRAPHGIEMKTALSVFGLTAISTLPVAKKYPKTALGILTATGLVLGSSAFFRQTPHTLPTPISFFDFENFLTNYLQNFSTPKGLLPKNKQPQTFAPIAPDLTLFGLPRLLICESDEIALMLRANRFHLETPCGVLSLREAAPLNDNFRKMLSKAEEPQVFFLHDANLKAYTEISQLRRKLDLADEIPLNILGLRPIHAERSYLFVQKNSRNLPAPDFAFPDFLTEKERKFLLAGFSAEVAAVSPIRLLRVLRRLILNIPIPQSLWKLNLPTRKTGFIS